MKSLPKTLTQLLPARLHDMCQAEDFAANTALFLTGEQPRWMFFVLTGRTVTISPGIRISNSCIAGAVSITDDLASLVRVTAMCRKLTAAQRDSSNP